MFSGTPQRKKWPFCSVLLVGYPALCVVLLAQPNSDAKVRSNDNAEQGFGDLQRLAQEAYEMGEGGLARSIYCRLKALGADKSDRCPDSLQQVERRQLDEAQKAFGNKQYAHSIFLAYALTSSNSKTIADLAKTLIKKARKFLPEVDREMFYTEGIDAYRAGDFETATSKLDYLMGTPHFAHAQQLEERIDAYNNILALARRSEDQHLFRIASDEYELAAKIVPDSPAALEVAHRCSARLSRFLSSQKGPVAPGSAGPISPAAAQLHRLNVLLEEQLDNLAVGEVMFNPPNRMEYDEPTRVEVRITRDVAEGEKLTQALHGPGAPKLRALKVSSFMKASVGGDGFEVHALNEDEQVLGKTGFTEWAWDVTPKRTGRLKLWMRITARVVLPEVPEQKKDISVLEAVIDVHVPPAKLAMLQVLNHPTTVALSVVAMLFALLVVRRNRRQLSLLRRAIHKWEVRRNNLQVEIAHVLFMDIVGYSKKSMEEQRVAIDTLNRIVQSAEPFRSSHGRNSLVSLPTGDGMALSFFTDAEAPVRCAIEVWRSIRGNESIKLRMGIHSGPIYRVKDINANLNVAGGGINIAQRIMDCGDGGHILLSQNVAETLSQMDRWREWVHDLGEMQVKHGLKLRVFSLCSQDFGSASIPEKLQQYKGVGV